MIAGSAARPAAPAVDGPVAQSIRIGFRALFVGTLVLAAAWAVSNVRRVPSDMQAVVLRFGQVVRVQQPGLLLAWPRPIEDVVLLPGGDRQIGLTIDAGTRWGAAILDPASRASGDAIPPGAGLALTGDGGVVLLDAALTYRIDDAAAYVLASGHVAPALRRLFLAASVTVAGRRAMDQIIVTAQERGPAGNAAAQTRRQELRGELVREINTRLRALANTGSGLGVEVVRADVSAILPPAAKFAFDAVLDATQMAEQGLAAARTDAARILQAADQQRDRLREDARAAAEERVRSAQAQVAAITALEQRTDPAGRPSLLDQVYRERIAGILKQSGSVATVDTRGGSRLVLPGASP